MMRLSYLVLPRLTAFKSPDEFSHLLRHVRECGYDGVELNLTEPFGIEPAELNRMIRELGLTIPSFLTGEAYADGLCLSFARCVCRPADRRTADPVRRDRLSVPGRSRGGVVAGSQAG